MVVAEQYPELRAENFQQLQGQLTETENQIQITRRVYNDTVQTYNTLIQIFPAVGDRQRLQLRAARVLRRPQGVGGDPGGQLLEGRQRPEAEGAKPAAAEEADLREQGLGRAPPSRRLVDQAVAGARCARGIGCFGHSPTRATCAWLPTRRCS